MDALTKCPICLNELRSPKTLSCLHSYCQACLETFVKKGKNLNLAILFSQFQFQFHNLSFLLAASPTLKCPQCRLAFTLPKDGVKGLPCHYFTGSILGFESTSSQIDPNSIVCHGCEENPAIKYCNQCKEYFCELCIRPHMKGKATASHTYSSIEDSLQKGLSTRSSHCPQHPRQEITSFCNNCQVAICSDCAVDYHSGHNFSRLPEVIGKLQKDIKREVESVRPFLDALLPFRFASQQLLSNVPPFFMVSSWLRGRLCQSL